MASQDDFFKIHGAKELGKELRELSRGAQNQVFRPGLRKGAAEVRKSAKSIVKGSLNDTGKLHKAIKSKVFTSKRGRKGVSARIGILYNDKNAAVTDGKPTKNRPAGTTVAQYGQALNKKFKFLDQALSQSGDRATNLMITQVQVQLDKFHAKRQDMGKR